MRILTLPVLAAAFIALVGCSKDGDTNCTAIAAYSVNLQVTDDSGTPIADADVQYSVDGSAFVDCENFGNGSYACGIEETGDFVVDVEANGMADTVELTLEADECHVIGQSITVELVP